MFLDKIFSKGKKERQVIEQMREHIRLLRGACEAFHTAMEKDDRALMRKVKDLEREGDAVRRGITSDIYEGAFLPYLRPNLCRFVEIVDGVFDVLEHTAQHYLDMTLPGPLRRECTRIAFLNLKVCEMLLITLAAMLNGEDLREKTLAVRIYEKKVDDIKLGLFKDAREVPIENFWDGRTLSEFISGLTKISDVIEDASDYLQLIQVSMK
jgi:predicted phosphate transport protein (TIGR00153 family)